MRRKLYDIIDAGGNDKLSVLYDTLMIIFIIMSLIPLCLKTQTAPMIVLERISVTVFIVDYILRWITADLHYTKLGRRAISVYPITVWAIIDLLSILPSLSLIIASSYKTVRILRLFKSFRILKFLRYSKSHRIIGKVLKREKQPLLAVFYVSVGYIVITALITFSVEPQSFDDFFDAVYWATTALTTVGYGDIYPVTDFGRLVSMLSSLVGIAVVALPSGIITAGYLSEIKNKHEDD